ncbi:hypothetical protein TrispH2_006237 [Trichoplax sp. H2]|uniref:Uncharacterized protein n=1 Tax=Trichoplax adhaerens TaxID=10228 RepID=B3RQ30_TRIAD|nr:predicted protein [Trichoplax adhaerens]EDV27748.1 predicted protein [Trichoplax adhaerens]RDD40746.1 hypothetical protein TrispH2_006237 [Trichoplax sp. H2]|eukprot:XP_002109582.1 predicted protein [Trichoplax adhaerens]
MARQFEKLILLLVIITIPSCLSLSLIEGHYHTWWAVVQLPRQDVQDMLPKNMPNRNFTLQKPKLKGLKDAMHPVVFELGTEIHTGPIFPGFLQKTFTEFKFEIPWVNQAGKSTPTVYKYVIYTNSSFESFSTREFYNLNSAAIRMNMSANSYFMQYKDTSSKLRAEFQNQTAKFSPASSYKYFSVYQQVMSQEWFGDADPKTYTCANHHYDFSTTKVRPAKMQLMVSNGLLPPKFPTNKLIATPGLNQPLGTAEVFTTFKLTLPHSC